MIISTFNVNSVNARLPNLAEWLGQAGPDIVLLQEIKTEYNSFPFFELASAGYKAAVRGQKGYNGVAVLSRHNIETVREALPGFEDSQARYIETLVHAGGQTVRAISVYVPNGNPPYNNPDDETKFEYKLEFMKAFYRHAAHLLENNEKIILGGDFNVIYTPEDVYDPALFAGNALFRPAVRRRLSALSYLGFYDAYRVLHPRENGYTYWDYAGRAFEQDLGMRIDYLFLSPQMTDCLVSCDVDKRPRLLARPSDHVPLTARFELDGGGR